MSEHSKHVKPWEREPDAYPSRINLGCGDDYRQNWLNVDMHDYVRADEYADLDEMPWPWPDDCFEFALMDNVIEHLDDQSRALAELARIVEPGGMAVVRFPHWHSAGAYRPDHTQTISRGSFDGYDVGDLFAVREVSCTRIRAGRLMPERVALVLADHIGHIVSEVEVRLEVQQ